MFALIRDIVFADPDDAKLFTAQAVLVELSDEYDLQDMSRKYIAEGTAVLRVEGAVGEMADWSTPQFFGTRAEAEAYLREQHLTYVTA